MEEIDLKEEYRQLRDEVRVGSIADHDFPITKFFEIYSALAAENGDTPDLEYCPVLGGDSRKYRVDGFAFDFAESEGSQTAELYLIVCDFSQDRELPTINAKHVDISVSQGLRFLQNALSEGFIDQLEESSPAYQLSAMLRQYFARVTRIRLVIFSNSHLRTKKKVFESKSFNDLPVHVNVIDIERYARIALTGSEPVEIDFEEDFGGAIDCLAPSTCSENYTSYLFAISGNVLAKVFASFGNRLLEQNVRTYLQARTKVNKGILRTISEEPQMFFAYNNGVTATASHVRTIKSEGGDLRIANIHDFQIVNGGQTTASLLYARDSLNLDLSDVFVQVKLSVVEETEIDLVVPRISEYANTQNKVSLADLASNSSAQIQIQRLSQEIIPPVKGGELYTKKWFYERSRGQYKSMFSYKTASEKRKLELEYPRDQLITKTDLAKYEFSFDGLPHIVSMGAQKCFLKYTDSLSSKAATSSDLNKVWYKRAVAKAIIFKAMDSAVQQSSWYQEDRGYKAQIVTYAIAASADGFRRAGHQIDLDSIWERQEVPSGLLEWMLKVAEEVARIIKNPPADVRNISEYAKKVHCWESGISGRVGIPGEQIIERYGKSLTEYVEEHVDSQKEKRLHSEIDFEVELTKLIPRAQEIRKAIEAAGAASPKNISAISKLAAGNPNLNRGEKNALKYALERINVL